MQRLDLNLSTQPFRNNTLIWSVYGLATALLLGFAIWNGTTYYGHRVLLDEKKSHLQDLAAQQDDLDARERSAERERSRKELSLDTLTAQSLKANDVIEWKAFSWTELFNRLEAVLPWNVYMSAVRPIFRAERGADKSVTPSGIRSRPVAVEGYAKSLGALLDFERRLFASEHFDDPEPLRHAPDDRGELVFTMRFTYYPDGRPRRQAIEAEPAPVAEVVEVAPIAEVAEVGEVATQPRDMAARDDDWVPGSEAVDAGPAGVIDDAAQAPTIKRVSERAPGSKAADADGASRKAAGKQELRP